MLRTINAGKGQQGAIPQLELQYESVSTCAPFQAVYVQVYEGHLVRGAQQNANAGSRAV